MGLTRFLGHCEILQIKASQFYSPSIQLWFRGKKKVVIFFAQKCANNSIKQPSIGFDSANHSLGSIPHMHTFSSIFGGFLAITIDTKSFMIPCLNSPQTHTHTLRLAILNFCTDIEMEIFFFCWLNASCFACYLFCPFSFDSTILFLCVRNKLFNSIESRPSIAKVISKQDISVKSSCVFISFSRAWESFACFSLYPHMSHSPSRSLTPHRMVTNVQRKYMWYVYRIDTQTLSFAHNEG